MEDLILHPDIAEPVILPETAGKRKTWRQTEEKSRGKQGKEIKLIF